MMKVCGGGAEEQVTGAGAPTTAPDASAARHAARLERGGEGAEQVVDHSEEGEGQCDEPEQQACRVHTVGVQECT